MIVYLIGCFIAYFLTFLVFGKKRFLSVAALAILLGFFSWIGVTFLVVSLIVFKFLTRSK